MPPNKRPQTHAPKHDAFWVKTEAITVQHATTALSTFRQREYTAHGACCAWCSVRGVSTLLLHVRIVASSELSSFMLDLANMGPLSNQEWDWKKAARKASMRELKTELTQGSGYMMLRGVLQPHQVALCVVPCIVVGIHVVRQRPTLQVHQARKAVLNGASACQWESAWLGRRKRVTGLLEADAVFAHALETLPALPLFREILGTTITCGSYHALVLYNDAEGLAPAHPQGLHATRMRGMHTDYPWGAHGHIPGVDEWTCQAITCI